MRIAHAPSPFVSGLFITFGILFCSRFRRMGSRRSLSQRFAADAGRRPVSLAMLASLNKYVVSGFVGREAPCREGGSRPSAHSLGGPRRLKSVVTIYGLPFLRNFVRQSWCLLSAGHWLVETLHPAAQSSHARAVASRDFRFFWPTQPSRNDLEFEGAECDTYRRKRQTR